MARRRHTDPLVLLNALLDRHGGNPERARENTSATCGATRGRSPAALRPLNPASPAQHSETHRYAADTRPAPPLCSLPAKSQRTDLRHEAPLGHDRHRSSRAAPACCSNTCRAAAGRWSRRSSIRSRCGRPGRRD